MIALTALSFSHSYRLRVLNPRVLRLTVSTLRPMLLTLWVGYLNSISSTGFGLSSSFLLRFVVRSRVFEALRVDPMYSVLDLDLRLRSDSPHAEKVHYITVELLCSQDSIVRIWWERQSDCSTIYVKGVSCFHLVSTPSVPRVEARFRFQRPRRTSQVELLPSWWISM